MKMLSELLRGLLAAVMLAALSAVIVPATSMSAQAKSCGGLNQKACNWLKKGPECDAWLYKTQGRCRPCGGKGQRHCPIIKRGKACKPGLGISHGRCVAESGTVLGKIKSALTPHLVSQAKAETKKRANMVKAIADMLMRAMPRGREARDIIKAIHRKDPLAVQTILLNKPSMRDAFRQMRWAGFHTATVGIESSAAYGVGVGHETGVSMDLEFKRTLRLYTTTSLAGGYYFSGGNDLVISALRPRNDAIGGHTIGTVAEFDVGSGGGVNMWFTPKPFDFAGFAVGVGIGSVGGGGAATYGFTKVY
jgi:hypothetical protein